MQLYVAAPVVEEVIPKLAIKVITATFDGIPTFTVIPDCGFKSECTLTLWLVKDAHLLNKHLGSIFWLYFCKLLGGCF